jgi:pectinesterase inhibitor-like protein|uniref:Pectinesterase inhibitor domain-containing protein n=1 Tax=Fagus sylvatica TaxID=28930 RepID=A0A2N9ITP7_FAGSY
MKEMAASLLLSLMLAILLVCPTNARLSMKVTEDVLKEICSPHEDPPFCLQALKSDPRTPFVDLVGLTNISIHLADVAINTTLAMIGPLVNETADPKLKVQYDLCYQLYESNVGEIESAKYGWKAGDYEDVSVLASGCLTDCDDCNDAISITPSSPLSQKNKEVSHYCETMLLVSNRLSGDS